MIDIRRELAQAKHDLQKSQQYTTVFLYVYTKELQAYSSYPMLNALKISME